jgi:hypothetical protein
MEGYRRYFPDWNISSKGVFSRVHQVIRETDCLPSVCILSCERTVLRRFREIQTVNSQNCVSHRRVAYAGVAKSEWPGFTHLWRVADSTSWNKARCSAHAFLPLENCAILFADEASFNDNGTKNPHQESTQFQTDIFSERLVWFAW